MDFFDLVVGFETDMRNAVEQDLQHANQVGLATLMALRVLHRHGGNRRVHDLSGDLSITPVAARKLVDRLVRDGLAVRRPHPDDRRSSLIDLTPAGENARASGEWVARQVVADILGDELDIPALTRALELLRARALAVHDGVLA